MHLFSYSKHARSDVDCSAAGRGVKVSGGMQSSYHHHILRKGLKVGQ